jgi:hypothetical protein
MNRYDMKTPRGAFGFAAAAMTALTLGLAVVLPAVTNDSGPEPLTEARNSAAPTVVTIEPSHIEIVGVREQTVASARVPMSIDLIAAREREAAKAPRAHGGSR